MSDDGIAYLGDDHYSMTFEFSDINYNNTSEAIRIGVFEKYCYFLNAYDDAVKIQVHIKNCQMSKTATGVFLSEKDVSNSELLQCVKEYNGQMEDRRTGSDSYIQQKYITLTVCEPDLESARRRFERLDIDTLAELRTMKCKTHKLDFSERLYLLRDMYRKDDTSEISSRMMAHTGVYGKDIIAPYSIDTTRESYIKFHDFYAKTLFIANFPEELSDEIIKDIASIDENLFITINLVPQNPQFAIAETRKKLKRLDREEYDNINRQLKMNVPMPKTSRDLQRALDNTEDFLNDLQTRNEKMFLANVLILVRGDTTEDVDAVVTKVTAKVNKCGCDAKSFSFAHEDGFNSVIPLGRNDTFIKRTFTTTSVAVFSPFNVIEIVQDGGFSYGKNSLSNNLLFLSRKRLTNPHGFYFGTSGSGKSMGAKAEIWECFWRTNDDMIIIDPDGEFAPLVRMLGGQVVDVSTTSQTFFNPFDINDYYGGDEEPDPVPFKSDFIISLIEVSLNYRDGIDPITRSIIDRCVREIYKPYLLSKSELDIPTFIEFFDKLLEQPEQEAKYLASSLEIYIKGSLNIFAKRTNIELNNRLVCFNTKNLGKQLKVMGMTIVQDFCWNLISQNQKENSNTWLWNDEIHHSLKNPYTCEWLIQSWKRGRKYGLIATGMTQEVKDCCLIEEARALIANSEFLMVYRQKEEMLPDLVRILSLSTGQKDELLSCEPGTGYLKAGDSVVKFNNRYNKGTSLYQLMQTSIGKADEKAV